MAGRSPIFPMAEPHHYSDYGFDPQMGYLQVLEEARRHGKRSSDPRSPDAIHFTLRKPISKDDRGAKSKKRRKWWKAALLFWKRDTTKVADRSPSPYIRRDRAVSGPVYMIESGGSGSSTPCRTSSRPGSGPLRAAEAAMPYLSLRELNLMEDDHHHHHRMSASGPAPMPMYLVT